MGGLKGQREKLGISIKEAAAKTKIKHYYLQAIEDGEFEKLPVEVYARGYIKEYARFLDVSCSELLAAYKHYLDKKNQGSKKQANEISGEHKKECASTVIPPPAVIPPPNEILTQPNSLKKNKEEMPVSFILRLANNKTFWQKSLYIALPAITVVLVYLLFLSGKDNINNVAKDAKTAEQIGLQADHQQYIQKKAEDLATKTEASAIHNKKENYHLEVTATDTVWLKIVIDDSETRDILLNPGEMVNYTAGQSFSIIIGNAGGVKLKFNDKEIGSLGDKGQVVRLTLPEKSSVQ